MTPETTIILLESDTVVENGVIRHFVTANIATALDTDELEQKIRDALVKLGWRHEPPNVATVTGSRQCATCNWELPSKFTGYSGPCPRCLSRSFGYTVLEAPAQKLRSKPSSPPTQPFNVPLNPDKAYLVCDVFHEMSCTDKQGWFRADVVYKVESGNVTHLDTIRVIHVGDEGDRWKIMEEVPEVEPHWFVRIPGLRESPKFDTEKSAEAFCDAMGRTFTTEYFTP